ncbi:LamG-like jellyroll fold domain-containing protein, partial [Nanoarchaeota archaeon]
NINDAPTVSSVVLQSSLGTNYETEDLNVTYSLTDLNSGDNPIGIIDWVVDSSSIIALNMPFEGGSTDTFTMDLSENTYDSTGITNGVWNQAGGYNGLGYYDITSGQIMVEPVDVPTGQITLMGWFRTSDFSTNGGLICKEPYGAQWCLYLNQNDVVAFRTSTTDLASPWTTELVDDSWNFIAATYDGATRSIYVNGELLGSDSDNLGLPNDLVLGTNNVSIGSISTLGSLYEFDGSIDDVKIFNRALSAGQIRAMYDSGNGRDDLIDSQETIVGEDWQACVTPLDDLEPGSQLCGNTITILQSPNFPPYFSPALADQTVDEGQPLTYNVNANDDNSGDTWSFTSNVTNLGGDSSIDSASGLITWTPGADESGSYLIEVEVCDDSGQANDCTTGTFTIFVNDVNQIPTVTIPVVASTYGTDTTVENLTVTYTLGDNDAGDNPFGIVNWKLAGQPIASLILPFEANGGFESTTTYDYSGNANDGVVVNAVWNATGDKNGNGAYSLDGTGNGISVDASGMNNYMQEITVMGLVDFGAKDLASGDWRVSNQIVAQRGGLFTLVQQGSGSLLFRVWNESNYNDLSAGNDISTPLGWQHVAATYSAGVMTVYIEGVEINSNAIAFTGDIGKAGNIEPITLMGSSAGDSSLNGSLDDLRVYDIALSAEQISQLASGNDDVIVSQETSKMDFWQACVTPNDGKEDGTEECSNTLQIVNTAPVANDVTDNTNEATEVIVTLDYTDADNDQATSCIASGVQNGQVSTFCGCIAGVCTVGLTPTSTADVIADYTVNDGNVDSNS